MKKTTKKYCVKELFIGKVLMCKSGVFVLNNKLSQAVLKRLYEKNKDKIEIN